MKKHKRYPNQIKDDKRKEYSECEYRATERSRISRI